MSDAPIYTSKSSVKSLWQEYRIYEDRLEFGTLFGQMTIPFDQIETVEVSQSDLKGLLKGDLKLKGFRPALKLDWANFVEHIVLDKSGGWIHRVLFTPDDPKAFKSALDRAVTRFRDDQSQRTN
ncbi:MAG: hypothetical protein U0792_19075 [Gemmataceae bacterium]